MCTTLQCCGLYLPEACHADEEMSLDNLLKFTLAYKQLATDAVMQNEIKVFLHPCAQLKAEDRVRV